MGHTLATGDVIKCLLQARNIPFSVTIMLLFQALINKTVETFGQIDCLINNAGWRKLLLLYSIYYCSLSHEVTSWSDITSCYKINKPLVVYRFTSSWVMTSIQRCVHNDKAFNVHSKNAISKYFFNVAWLIDIFRGEYRIYFIECVEIIRIFMSESSDVFKRRDDIYLVFTEK